MDIDSCTAVVWFDKQTGKWLWRVLKNGNVAKVGKSYSGRSYQPAVDDALDFATEDGIVLEGVNIMFVPKYREGINGKY